MVINMLLFVIISYLKFKYVKMLNFAYYQMALVNVGQKGKEVQCEEGIASKY